MSKATILIFLALAAFASPVWAQPAKDHASHHPGSALAEGEVRRVDKEAKKITIRHGPIQNLDMPAHTMVFQAKDPAMLERVKVGDKVKFEAQKIDGAYVLMSIVKAE